MLPNIAYISCGGLPASPGEYYSETRLPSTALFFQSNQSRLCTTFINTLLKMCRSFACHVTCSILACSSTAVFSILDFVFMAFQGQIQLFQELRLPRTHCRIYNLCKWRHTPMFSLYPYPLLRFISRNLPFSFMFVYYCLQSIPISLNVVRQSVCMYVATMKTKKR